MAPKLKLWELAGDNPDWSFSPFVWRVRFALAYKGLSYEYQAWRFTEKDLIKPCKTASATLWVTAAAKSGYIGVVQVACSQRTYVDPLAMTAGTNF